MEMTIRDTGAAGVRMAINDGMKAAGYARQLDAANAANDALMLENRQLRREIREKMREVSRLKRENKRVTVGRRQAFSWTMAEQQDHIRVLSLGFAVGLGAVLMCAVSIAVVVLVGV